MAKRKPNHSPPTATAPTGSGAPLAAHPPAKHPTLLAVSIVLFALWFVFLLIAAIWQ